MLRAGQLIVAAPTLPEPFEHAVILVLEHDESGSLGVVLNHPSTLDVGKILPDWRSSVLGEPVIFAGGPVATDSALALAAVPGDDEPEGFRRVVGLLGLVDLDTRAADLDDQVIALRIFAGYAGWSPGQLAGEIKEGSWAVADLIDPLREVFGHDPQDQWTQVLKRQPGTTSWWAHCPIDPSVN
jgi:putative transcriptional regulator